MVNTTIFSKDVRILGNLPRVLTSIDEMKAIAKVEDQILSAEWGLINNFVDGFFINTADEKNLSRYENMLGLKVSTSDDLETRRLRIISRYQEQAPYTWKTLHNILDVMLGVDKYTVIRDVVNKKITVQLLLVVQSQFDVVADLIERITPQNMIIEIGLLFNTYSELSQFTHQQLSQFTHLQLREDDI